MGLGSPTVTSCWARRRRVAREQLRGHRSRHRPPPGRWHPSQRCVRTRYRHRSDGGTDRALRLSDASASGSARTFERRRDSSRVAASRAACRTGHVSRVVAPPPTRPLGVDSLIHVLSRTHTRALASHHVYLRFYYSSYTSTPHFTHLDSHISALHRPPSPPPRTLHRRSISLVHTLSRTHSLTRCCTPRHLISVPQLITHSRIYPFIVRRMRSAFLSCTRNLLRRLLHSCACTQFTSYDVSLIQPLSLAHTTRLIHRGFRSF